MVSKFNGKRMQTSANELEDDNDQDLAESTSQANENTKDGSKQNTKNVVEKNVIQSVKTNMNKDKNQIHNSPSSQNTVTTNIKS